MEVRHESEKVQVTVEGAKRLMQSGRAMERDDVAEQLLDGRVL